MTEAGRAMGKVASTDRRILERATLLALAGLCSGITPTTALAQDSSAALLESRRAQMRQFIQQQQVSLKNQLDCASSARSLGALDRCQRGYPPMGPGMHGGWGCPLW